MRLAPPHRVRLAPTPVNRESRGARFQQSNATFLRGVQRLVARGGEDRAELAAIFREYLREARAFAPFAGPHRPYIERLANSAARILALLEADRVDYRAVLQQLLSGRHRF